MKAQIVFVAMAIAVFVLAAGGAYSAQLVNGAWVPAGYSESCPNYNGTGQTIWVCPNSAPAGVGAGPATGQAAACPSCSLMTVYPGPCDQCSVARGCGAFCQAGNQPAGWPYGWCSEYWLRPDSNF